MPDPVLPAQTNTEAGKPSEDIKAGVPTVLGSEKDAEQGSLDLKEGSEGEAKPVLAKEGEKVEEKPKEEGKIEGTPEKYELKAPEGVTLDPELLTELTTVAKELKLTNGNAQKFADMGSKLVEKTIKGYQEQQETAFAKAGKEWLKEIETDKEFGGTNLKASNEAAYRFRDKFTTKEERAGLSVLFDSAWGNHPILWRLFVRAGKAIGEDRMIDGDRDGSGLSDAEVLYPNQGKE